jgi:tetratricopeptide (TPR) repeat protein
MEKIEILRKLFAGQELREYLEEVLNSLQAELDSKDYSIAVFYSFDAAYIYELLGDRRKAEHYYQTTLDYLNHAKFQWLGIRIECLRALGRHQEALETALNDPAHIKLRVAALHEDVGKCSIARDLYTKLAIEQSKKADEVKGFFQLHHLQEASDLWDRARNRSKTLAYNQRAVEAWEKMKDTIPEPRKLIEEAWLYEEVGYIYEKAGKFETALKYYEKAKSKYEEAYTEDPESVIDYQIDGDWDFYKEYFFYVQFLGLPMYKLRVEHPMKYDHRRIRYRILNLKEQMKMKIDRS